jgi:hypothetical protein
MSDAIKALPTDHATHEPSHAVSALRVGIVSAGVCYRLGKPTIADYNEAITDLMAARRQIKSGSLMGCSIRGDSGHAPQDALCHHDPLLLARKWAAATNVWQCYHCGYVATNDAEAREHFGATEFDAASCQRGPARVCSQ